MSFINNLVISRKHIIITLVALLVFAAVIVIPAIFLQPSPEQKENQVLLKKTTAAIQKESPGAIVKNATTADGFIKGTVTRTKSGQDYIAIFKASESGDMTELTSGSEFDPITLLQLGISFANQAKLNNQSVDDIKKSLMSQCNYTSGNTPGYDTSSFRKIKTREQISLNAGDIQYLQSKLNTAIQAKNSNQDDKIVCVSAMATDNAQKTNSYISIATSFQVQFITGSGSISTHQIIMTVHYLKSGGPTTVTLDGVTIK